MTSRDERVAEVDDRLQQPALVPFDQPLLFARLEVGVRVASLVLVALLRCAGRLGAIAPRVGDEQPHEPAGDRGDPRATKPNGGSSDGEHALRVAADDEQRQHVLAEDDVDGDAGEQRAERLDSRSAR